MVLKRTVFIELFGENPILKVLDFLIVHEEFDYSMTDIANFSKVGYSTLKLFWEKLEKERIVVNTRTVGKAKMYKINAVNPAVRKFKEFYWEITKQAVNLNVNMNITPKILKLKEAGMIKSV